MRILGCFKVVPDLEQVMEQDWKKIENNKIDVSFIKTIWNCFDESALEMMLKLSDLSEGFNVLTKLDALTIGDEVCNQYLKTLYALKFDEAVRIEPLYDVSFMPLKVAELITAYVQKKASYQAIVMGNQNAVAANGKTPILVAHKLGWRCITQVIDMEPIDETHIKVRYEQQNGSVTEMVELPCVFSIGNAPNSYLRVPTLKDRMKLGKRPIITVKEEELEIRNIEETEELVELYYVNNQRDAVEIKGNGPEEKARILFDDFLKERLEKL